MDLSLFKSIVDEATTYGSRSFSLHLFGETLFYPHILDAITYIKKADSSHTILLTTNGTYLEKFIKEDRLFHADQILWSWRKEAKFTEATKEKLRKWGKFRVRFIKEVTPLEAYKEWENWPNVEHRSLHNYGGNIDVTSFTAQTTGGSPERRHPCYHLWMAPAISWNGNILICCADPKQSEVLGKFPETSMHEAWTGKKLQEIRQSHLRGEFKGICASCDVWKRFPEMFFKWQKR